MTASGRFCFSDKIEKWFALDEIPLILNSKIATLDNAAGIVTIKRQRSLCR